jgi:hypothetical protein
MEKMMKGSQEMKDKMAKLRAMAMEKMEPKKMVKRKATLVKGSAEAKAFMSKIRSMKK